MGTGDRLASQLPDVINELEVAITTGKNAENPTKALLDGVEMTLKKLRNT
ncbi:MAG: hypothetical protein FWE56_05995 [Candidatus Bathyarchaeota archaeon]|nr:hypothetical protein [Candidatus Termiticorpusculum sp.]MCL2868436.1 hypothetical protein [Candidatus Termiticorpusculum sp.]